MGDPPKTLEEQLEVSLYNNYLYKMMQRLESKGIILHKLPDFDWIVYGDNYHKFAEQTVKDINAFEEGVSKMTTSQPIKGDTDELRQQILTEFKQVLRLAPADYTENCTNVVMSIIGRHERQAVQTFGEEALGERRLVAVGSGANITAPKEYIYAVPVSVITSLMGKGK